MQRPVNGRGVLLESCVEPGRFVVPQKAGDGDVLLKLLPVCANASCTAEASRFSFDEAVRDAMLSWRNPQSGEQLFARHQFGTVHMHKLEAHGIFVGDATWRVESGLSSCDDATRRGTIPSVRLVPHNSTTDPSRDPSLPSLHV